MKIERSLPYFNSLLKTQSSKRMMVLNAFPSFVIDDLIEVLYNIVVGRVDIGTRKRHLNKHRKVLLDIVNAKDKLTRRKVIYKQKGGFIAAVLPIALAALGLTKFL